MRVDTRRVWHFGPTPGGQHAYVGVMLSPRGPALWTFVTEWEPRGSRVAGWINAGVTPGGLAGPVSPLLTQQRAGMTRARFPVRADDTRVTVAGRAFPVANGVAAVDVPRSRAADPMTLSGPSGTRVIPSPLTTR